MEEQSIRFCANLVCNTVCTLDILHCAQLNHTTIDKMDDLISDSTIDYFYKFLKKLKKNLSLKILE